jgi:hypothetical protein
MPARRLQVRGSSILVWQARRPGLGHPTISTRGRAAAPSAVLPAKLTPRLLGQLLARGRGLMFCV